MKRIVKVHKVTREIVAVFPSAKEAGEDAHCTANRIRVACRKKRLFAGMYYYRFEESFDPDEIFEGKRCCPVLLHDTLLLEEDRYYGDLSECAEKAGWVYDHIKTTINNKGSLLGKRYRPEYVKKRIAE